MTMYRIEDDALTNIASAIREKRVITNIMTPADMVTQIMSMDNFYTEYVQVTQTYTNGVVTLMQNSPFLEKNKINPTFFIVIFGLQVQKASGVSNKSYQWHTACECASPVLTASDDASDALYGFGAVMYYKNGSSQTPQTLEIDQPMSNSNTNSSTCFGYNDNNDVLMYLKRGEYLGPGLYKVLLGTLMTMEELMAQQQQQQSSADQPSADLPSADEPSAEPPMTEEPSAS